MDEHLTKHKNVWKSQRITVDGCSQLYSSDFWDFFALICVRLCMCVFDFFKEKNEIKYCASKKAAKQKMKKAKMNKWKFNFQPDDLYNDATISCYRMLNVPSSIILQRGNLLLFDSESSEFHQISIYISIHKGAHTHKHTRKHGPNRHSQLIVELIYSYLSRSSFFIVFVNAFVVPFDGVFSCPSILSAGDCGRLRVKRTQTHPRAHTLSLIFIIP